MSADGSLTYDKYARTTHGKAQTFNKEGNSPNIERR